MKSYSSLICEMQSSSHQTLINNTSVKGGVMQYPALTERQWCAVCAELFRGGGEEVPHPTFCSFYSCGDIAMVEHFDQDQVQAFKVGIRAANEGS